MQIGVNAWVWTSPLTTEELEKLAPKVKDRGFDWIEVPLEGLEDMDHTAVVWLWVQTGI
jgi:D-psicose/D-tagatose/L-ribulose 3-epimerase